MSVRSSNARILIVDDESSLREVLSIMLHRQGYQVDTAVDGAQAASRLRSQSYDLVISDIRMPRMSGLELLRLIKEQTPETVVVMITAFSTSDEAVEAMKQGAYDYITKPFNNEEIKQIVKNALERYSLRIENQALKEELGRRFSFEGLVGKSKAMQTVISLIRKVAPTPAKVLITGENPFRTNRVLHLCQAIGKGGGCDAGRCTHETLPHRRPARRRAPGFMQLYKSSSCGVKRARHGPSRPLPAGDGTQVQTSQNAERLSLTRPDWSERRLAASLPRYGGAHAPRRSLPAGAVRDSRRAARRSVRDSMPGS